MLTKLLLLFIIIPVVELILLIEIGQLIGTLPTIALIISTGVLGAFLARRQGLQVLGQVRSELEAGRLPAGSIFDGVIILVAGAFLMTPGILTDTLGFLCLIPTTRGLIKNVIWSRLERAIRQGHVFTATIQGMPPRDEPEDVIILDPDNDTSYR